MNSVANSESLNFGVHQDILKHLIFKQHHSLVGTMVELVQNAFDAEATRLDIQIDDDGFSVTDNGKGFSSREDIINWFATFGKAHDADHLSKFGRFRMGRGQIMAKARTRWQSNEFFMDVDVMSNGLTFDLSTSETKFSGCKITGEWYDKEKHKNEIHNLPKALAEKCKYLFDMDIWINGNSVTVDPNKTEWDYENDLYRYIKNTDSLDLAYYRGHVNVYNLGIFCGTIETAGYCGDVITKEHVSLNMTRSEIQEGCPVIKRIKMSLRKMRTFDKNKKYSHWEAQKILLEFFTGAVDIHQIIDLLMFSNTINNTWYSIQSLRNRRYSFSYSDNKVLNDRVSQAFSGILLSAAPLPCLHEACLKDLAEKMSLDISGYGRGDWEAHMQYRIWFFMNFLESKGQEVNENQGKNANFWPSLTTQYVSFLELLPLADLSNHLLEYDELSASEKLRFLAVQRIYHRLTNFVGFDKHVTLRIGVSTKLNGWTDCNNFIALDRKVLNSLDKGLGRAIDIIQILIHEACHVLNRDGDLHDANFYKLFHDLTMQTSLVEIAGLILTEYDNLLAKQNKKPGPHIFKAMKFYRRDGLSMWEKKKGSAAINGEGSSV